MIKWLLLLFPIAAIGKDFGCMGQTFPIQEESLLVFMQKKASKQGLDRKSFIEQAKHPKPVTHLTKALESRSFLVDCSCRVEGVVVNPLEKIQLTTGLLFFDSDDLSQLEWARGQKDRFKWILVKGDPIELEKQEKRPIYFDQSGSYTTHFQIKHIPARITQKQHQLFVEEVALKI